MIKSGSNKFYATNWFAFWLIVLLNVLFKVIYLDKQGFWYDEMLSVYNSHRNWGHIKHISEWDPNPPLYFYFVYIWKGLFGISEFAIRFSSVLFSALAGGLLYLFVKRNFSQIAAIVSSLFFLSSNLVFFQSHEARPYSLILFLTVISFILFFDLLQKPVLWKALLLGLINFMLVYTHYLTAYIIFCELIAVLFLFKKRQTLFFLYGCGLFLLLAFWRFTKKTILLLMAGGHLTWLQKPDLKSFFSGLAAFFNGQVLLISVLVLGCVAILIHLMLHKKSTKDEKVKWLFLLLCGPFTFIAFYLLSNITPMYLERYMLFAIIPLSILYAGSMVKVFRKNLFILSGSIILFGFSVTQVKLNEPKPMDYKGAVGFIKNFKSDKTIVIVESIDMEALFAYYYDKKLFSDFEGVHKNLNAQKIYPIKDKTDFDQIELNGAEEIVVTQTYVTDKGIIPFIPRDFKLIEITEKYKGVKIFFFRRQKA